MSKFLKTLLLSTGVLLMITLMFALSKTSVLASDNIASTAFSYLTDLFKAPGAGTADELDLTIMKITQANIANPTSPQFDQEFTGGTATVYVMVGYSQNFKDSVEGGPAPGFQISPGNVSNTISCYSSEQLTDGTTSTGATKYYRLYKYSWYVGSPQITTNTYSLTASLTATNAATGLGKLVSDTKSAKVTKNTPPPSYSLDLSADVSSIMAYTSSSVTVSATLTPAATGTVSVTKPDGSKFTISLNGQGKGNATIQFNATGPETHTYSGTIYGANGSFSIAVVDYEVEPDDYSITDENDDERCPYCGAPKHPLDFHASQGGALPRGPHADTPSGSSSVNISTGAFDHKPSSDSFVNNPTGPSINVTRSYSTDLAYTGKSSPGFSSGWTHNYDVTIRGNTSSSGNTWSALNLVYPNYSTIVIRPNLSGNGSPTGTFITQAGSPFVVTGVPGSSTNEWNSITVTFDDGVKWLFAKQGGSIYVLSRISDKLNRYIDLNYDSGSRRLLNIKDSNNATLLTYNYSNGLISSTTDCYNKSVSYTHDIDDNLSAVSEFGSNGSVMTYSYTEVNGKMFVDSVSTCYGGSSTINYSDQTNKVSSYVDANGNSKSYTYTPGTKPSPLGGKLSVETSVVYKDSNGNVASETTKILSNTDERISTDQNGNTLKREYKDSDNPQKPTKIILKDGKTIEIQYDSFGHITRYKDAAGHVTVHNYSYGSSYPVGRLTSSTKNGKTLAAYTYYSDGLIKTISSPKPGSTSAVVTTTYTYSNLGNIASIVSPGPNGSVTTTFNYTQDGNYTATEKLGQPLTITDCYGNITHYRYDSSGNPVSVTDADGRQTNYSYNAAGQATSITLPPSVANGSDCGSVSRNYKYVGGPLTYEAVYDEDEEQVSVDYYTYTGEGQLSAYYGNGESVSYSYDVLGNIKSLSDGKGNTTSYTYDSSGNLRRVNLPGGDFVLYTGYDLEGRLLSKTDGNGDVTNYTYNSDGQLTGISYPTNSSRNITLAYDTMGNISSMTDITGTTTYQNDLSGNITSVTTAYTGISSKTISYNYNSDGSRSSMQTPGGTFTYSYDNGGLLTSITNPFGLEISYTSSTTTGAVLSKYTDTGIKTDYAYDNLGQLVELTNYSNTNVMNSQFTASYDGVGRLVGTGANSPANAALSGSTSYSYNSKGELVTATSARGGGYNKSYSYDNAGNNTTSGLTFNSNNQISSNGYAYDDNGNPTTYRNTSLTFSPENQMLSYGSALTAEYRGDNMRAWKEDSDDGNRTYYLYDGITIIAEMDSDGEITALMTTLGCEVLARNETYYQSNIEGDVAHRLNANTGAVISSDVYDPYGNLVYGGSTADPYGYKVIAGYYKDHETGLFYLANRYYDPVDGRFINRDPIGYIGGINLYGYVKNNPVSFMDPSGLDPDNTGIWWLWRLLRGIPENRHLFAYNVSFGMSDMDALFPYRLSARRTAALQEALDYELGEDFIPGTEDPERIRDIAQAACEAAVAADPVAFGISQVRYDSHIVHVRFIHAADNIHDPFSDISSLKAANFGMAIGLQER